MPDPLPPGWLPEAVEAFAYEGLRAGDEAAFRTLAEPLQPVLCRLAALHVAAPSRAADLAVHGWAAALGGLDMFRWHTPFATWVAGITLGLARSEDAVPRGRPPPQSRVAAGPEDWSDLPWGARWQGALGVVAAELAALPVSEREVVHVGDVEGWGKRQACDVLALPEETYDRLVAAGRARIWGALAVHVGQPARLPPPSAQVAAVTEALALLRGHAGGELDPRVTAVYRRWRSGRRTGWRRLRLHLPGAARPGFGEPSAVRSRGGCVSDPGTGASSSTTQPRSGGPM